MDNGAGAAGVDESELARAKAVLPASRTGVYAFVAEGGMQLIPAPHIIPSNLTEIADSLSGIEYGADNAVDASPDDVPSLANGQIVPSRVKSQREFYTHFRQFMTERTQHQAEDEVLTELYHILLETCSMIQGWRGLQVLD